MKIEHGTWILDKEMKFEGSFNDVYGWLKVELSQNRKHHAKCQIGDDTFVLYTNEENQIRNEQYNILS